MSDRKALQLGGDKNVIIFCEQLIHWKRIWLLHHSVCSLPACFQMAAGSHPCPGGLQISQLWAHQPFLLHMDPGKYVTSLCVCPVQLWEDQVWCISSWLLLIYSFLRCRIRRCSIREHVCGFPGISGMSGERLLAQGSLVSLAGAFSTAGCVVFGSGELCPLTGVKNCSAWSRSGLCSFLSGFLGAQHLYRGEWQSPDLWHDMGKRVGDPSPQVHREMRVDSKQVNGLDLFVSFIWPAHFLVFGACSQGKGQVTVSSKLFSGQHLIQVAATSAAPLEIVLSLWVCQIYNLGTPPGVCKAEWSYLCSYCSVQHSGNLSTTAGDCLRKPKDHGYLCCFHSFSLLSAPKSDSFPLFIEY